MNRKSFISIIWILLFVAGFQTSGQVFLNDQIATILEYHNRNDYGEHVYIDMDRDLCFSGDELRFSIFLTESKYNLPQAQSRIVSVELLDPTNQPLVREKFTINESAGAGVLRIPENIATGNYTLRAYTNWMRNRRPEYYYHGTITIINPERPPIQAFNGQTEPLKVTVHPEGGHLIPDFTNRVAIRMLNKFNRPFTDQCYIVSAAHDTISRVKLNDQGIGLFNITPVSENTYGVFLGDSLYPLPQPNPGSVGLKVEQDNKKIAVQLFNLTTAGVDHPLHLLLHHHGNVLQYEMITPEKDRIEKTFRTTELPGGISEVVLLDHEHHLLASRLVGIKPEESNRLSISGDGSAGKRQPVNLKVETDPDALVAVSVYLPADSLAEENQAEKALMVNADAGAWIKSYPGDAALILAGQGNAGYAAITAEPVNDYPAEIRTDFISGMLLNGSRTNASDFNLYMANVGRNTDIEHVKFRPDGSFIISPVRYADPSQIVFINDSLKKLNIQIHTEFSNEFSTYATPKPNPVTFTTRNFNKLLVAHQINKIYRQRDTVQPDKTPYKFYGRSDEYIELKDYIELPVMEEFFRELFRYIVFTREKGKLKLNVLSKYNNRILGPEPMYLIDGIPVFDTKTILDLDPATIKSIRIKANRYIYGSTFMDGIIDIESYEGNASVLDLEDKIATYLYEPASSVSSSKINHVNHPVVARGHSDQRPVICWEPARPVGNDGRQEYSFVTSDITGTFRIKVTSISQDGVISQEFRTLTVE